MTELNVWLKGLAAGIAVFIFLAIPNLRPLFVGVVPALRGAEAAGPGLSLSEDDDDSEDGADNGEDPNAQVFAADSGPDKIDVSKYPEELQSIYRNTFSIKCSKCHTLARPINSDYALPKEWSDYVEKMRKKRRSGIRAKDAVKIKKFLIFDSALRKKKLIEEKLKKKETEEQSGKTEEQSEKTEKQ